MEGTQARPRASHDDIAAGSIGRVIVEFVQQPELRRVVRRRGTARRRHQSRQARTGDTGAPHRTRLRVAAVAWSRAGWEARRPTRSCCVPPAWASRRIESAGTNAAQLMRQLLSVELPVVRGGGGTNAIARPVIECSSLEEAVEIAAGHPVAQTGTIEVRPLWGN